MIYNIVHSLLREAENLNAYGLFSFVLFFAFFIGVLVWTCCMKRSHLSKMENLPLDGGEANDKRQS